MKFEDLYKYDTFANENGVVLDELNDDFAKMSIKIEKRHLNGGATAHGAVIFLLADITMAAMANHKQFPSVSIQSDIRFFAAAFEGDTITAQAVEVFGRKSLNNCRVTIVNQNGDMIAVAEGMFYVKQKFKVNNE
ncbi:MAG: PaaI family thioesterase [Rikenellaceae bacterium]